MNPLKKKFASTMLDAARKGIRELDETSPHAKAIRDIDIECVLHEDIHKFCDALSFGEMAAMSSIAAKYGIASCEKEQAMLKDRMKEVALKVVERVERTSGKFKLPGPCRDMLMKL